MGGQAQPQASQAQRQESRGLTWVARPPERPVVWSDQGALHIGPSTRGLWGSWWDEEPEPGEGKGGRERERHTRKKKREGQRGKKPGDRQEGQAGLQSLWMDGWLLLSLPFISHSGWGGKGQLEPNEYLVPARHCS